MNKYILALAVLPLFSAIVQLLQISSAKADNGFYIKSGIGINSMTNIKSENEFFINDTKMTRKNPVYELAIGYATNNDIKLELAFDYHFLFFVNQIHTENAILDDDHKKHINTYKISINTLMLNAYKNILTFHRITPFIGGGIGIGFRKSSLSSKEQTNKVQNKKLVYKLTFGIDYKINDVVTTEISYNYFTLNKDLLGDYHKNKPLQIHNITIGTRINL